MDWLNAQGVDVPSVGLGTWQLTGSECVEAVRHALELGYRHLDTARMYRNERQVGEGVRASGVERSEVFLVTKLQRSELSPAAVPRAAEDSLRALATDYVDLLLIHWPSRTVPLEATLEAMSGLVERRLVRRLGVSNFPPELLRQAASQAPVLTDQVEHHPYVDQRELLTAARDLGVLVTAYSPVAKGRVVRDAVLAEIGAAHGKSAVQVALRWLLDQGVAVIPRSRSAKNRAANLDVFDFTLSEQERARIDGLSDGPSGGRTG